MSTELERETIKCSDCRIWDPENQPSVQRALEEGRYKGRLVVTVRNGTTMSFPSVGTVPLWSDVLTCVEHQEKWGEEWKTVKE